MFKLSIKRLRILAFCNHDSDETEAQMLINFTAEQSMTN